jgi:hypothetical protein
MRVRTRHPRVAAAACRIYGLVIWLYPPGFRRAFGRELVTTFRNRVEDVLNDGGIRQWIAFAAHIAWDTLRTCGTPIAPTGAQDSASLLGLRDGDAAHGGLDRAIATVDLLFAAAGLVLGCGGWYAYFVVLPSYVQ